MKRPPLLVIVGPTGVGKTAVAVRLAERLPIEAVNADSRQVYRGMDIGTGKPTPAERAALAHHLIDIVDPDERFHAARFRTLALRAVEGIRERGGLPLVVGGTGLYIRALLKGLRPAPPADPVLRRDLETFVSAHGSPALHERLHALDPEAAKRLHPNDHARIIRAIEIRARSLDRQAESQGCGAGEWVESVPPWHLLMVGLTQSREALNRRLAERARRMVARGMMEEVRRLLEAGYDPSLPAMAGIGYGQFCAVIKGHMTEAEALRLMIRDTTRYAKRQMTWFARDLETRWIDVDAAGGLDGAAESILKQTTQEGLIE